MAAYDQLRRSGLFGEEIVTGEAVALEMPYATVAARITSAMIDALIYIPGMAISIYVVARHTDDFTLALLRTLIIVDLMLWVWIIPALVTVIGKGRSVGKLVTGTRIVRTDGGAIQPLQAFVRSLVGIFELWITMGLVALAVVAISRRAQRLGDMLAGTYIVKWPKKKKFGTPHSPDPLLVSWMSTAQTRELPAGLTLNISAFLRSVTRLDPRIRQEQARQLAATAEQYVYPAPPLGTPPERFLETLLAMRFSIETQANRRILDRRNTLYKRLSRIS